ncbi:MAG: PilZ domain-containing protein [Dissulfurispiraceae bacterium]
MEKKQQRDKTKKSIGSTSSKKEHDRSFFRVDAHIHMLSGLVPHEERANISSRELPSTPVSAWETETLKKVNISGAGIAFHSDDFYAVGDIVALKMMFKKDWAVPLLVYGEVMRVEPLTRYCRVAVKFVALNERIKSIIMRFVFERERDIIAEKRVGWL